MEQTYATQLRQVRDSLTAENWHKGSYFSVKGNQICNCVHGAAQRIVNPQIRKSLQDYNTQVNINIAAFAGTAASAAERFREGRDDDGGIIANRKELWTKRNRYYRNDTIYNNLNYGNQNLHYLMGMFGITASFNDSKKTTLKMLKAKLTEAADWSEANEEFLRNN